MEFTQEQVATHNQPEDCWIIIGGKVYDVSTFLDEHPGGRKMILRFAGKDATAEYEPIHPANALEALSPNAFKGSLKAHVLAPDTAVAHPTSGTAVSIKDSKPPSKAEVEERMPMLHECLSLRDLELAAEKVFNPRAFAYIKGAADDEWTANHNESIFSKIRLRPRVMVDISQKLDTSVSVMGVNVSLPFLIAPAARAKQAHPDGELALARAAAKFGVGQGVCTNASYGFESVIKTGHESGSQAFFYQVYVHKDRPITERTLKKAKELGYKGLLFTVDAPVVGKRERDERMNLVNEDVGSVAAVGTGAPVAGQAKASSTYFDPKLTWSDISWIRSIVGDSKAHGLPIAIKGIQTAEDAALCANMGCHIYISNHGGRQLDGAPSPIEVLLEIRKHCPWVFDTVQVYVDGGIRRGTDVLKLISLGCTAVFLGRPFLYSLAFGQQGVEKLIEILSTEIATGMSLLGVTSLRDLRGRVEYVNAKALQNVVSDVYNGPKRSWSSLFRAKL